MIQKQLNTIQRGLAQKICKSYRTASLNSTLILARLLPLDLRVKEAAQMYEARSGRLGTSNSSGRPVESRISFLEAQHPALEEEIGIGSLEDMHPETLQRRSLPEAQVYTDGSKLEGKVGAAYTYWIRGVEKKIKKMRLESFCTVFQAELYAIYQATELLQKERPREVAVLSDSRSALQLIQDPESYHPLGFKIRQNVANLRRNGCEVKMFWVKAHVGVPGNERADELAKQAALKIKTAANYDRCPISFIKNEIRQNSVIEWAGRYEDGETAKVTKLFLPNASRAYLIMRKIKLTPILTQVMTGHGGFSAYLNKYKCKESPSCSCDSDKVESIEHLLLECPINGADRCDLETATSMELTQASLCEMMAGKATRPHLFAYCTKVAEKAIKRNKTR